MTEQELQQYIRTNYPKEDEGCEWKEFKSLKNDFNGKVKDDVVSYVSALANMEGGHLVVGVADKTLEIVGTDTYNYDVEKARLRLTDQCANLPSEGLLVEEFVTDDTQKTVWVIHVPKHICRRPVYAHSKAWMRLDDSLVEMTDSRLDSILNEVTKQEDWTAEVIPEATIDDLDPKAIKLAREKFVELHPHREQEVKDWDDATFLNKAKITIGGKITRAAIILVGREESEHFLLPAVCKIRWTLREVGKDGNKDFHIFSIPMILAIEEYSHIVRNTTYTYTIQGDIYPKSFSRYDIFTLREPVCNMIGHQNYLLGARMEVVEYEDHQLMFRNYGTFLPESVERVVSNNYPESLYRNPFLIEAMRNVKMVETEGGGILKLYKQQIKRLLPLPTYDMSKGMVSVVIEGRVRDMHYAQLLANHPELTVHQITLLDKVQKGMMLTDVEKADIEGMIAENRDGTLGVLVSNDDRLISLSDAIDKKDVVDAVADKLTERQRDIYNILLRSVVDAVVETAESIAVKIGCSSRTIQRDLAVLQKLGLIQREGADNGGRWIVCRKG